MKIDEVDAKILKSLMEDGRSSFREVARKTSLTTPTVSSRFARMMKGGLILKFVPVFAPDSTRKGVVAFVTLETGTDSEALGEAFAMLPEVEGAFVTTGESSLILKVAVRDVKELRSFLRERVTARPGIVVLRTQIITSFIKEVTPTPQLSVMTIDLKCDYCGGSIESERPYNVAAGYSRYYFCCRICRKAYLEEHGTRLAKIRAATDTITLHS